MQSLHNAHLKRSFLSSFADDPATFIQQWLESQSRDLENILGSGPSMGKTLRAEELRRAEFFKLPWVGEVSRAIPYLLSKLGGPACTWWTVQLLSLNGSIVARCWPKASGPAQLARRRSNIFLITFLQAVAIQEGLRHSQKGVQNP